MGLLQDIREVLGMLSHRGPKAVYCPKCTSAKIYSFSPKMYKCEDCGYIGSIVMELEKEEK